MKEASVHSSDLRDTEKACEALNYLLGGEKPIPAASLISAFNSPEKMRALYRKGAKAHEVKEVFIAGAEGEGDTSHLTTAGLVADGVAAFWQWARVGFGIASPEQYEARLAACGQCNNYVDAPKMNIYKIAGSANGCNKICAVCGCMVEKKARFLSGKCPGSHDSIPGLSKWEEPL